MTEPLEELLKHAVYERKKAQTGQTESWDAQDEVTAAYHRGRAVAYLDMIGKIGEFIDTQREAPDWEEVPNFDIS